MVHDPVCGMEIKDISNAEKFEYKGKTYYFCSIGCKDKFSHEPENYLKKDGSDCDCYCPKCKTELKKITKDELDIDFCPSCKGVWLDRRELDKIIERTDASSQNIKKSANNASKKNVYDASYLASLFDFHTGSVNERASYYISDDLK